MSTFRQLMIGNKDGIPTRYIVVDYIQSSGTEYINTGIVATGNTYFEWEFELLNKNNVPLWFCGGCQGWDNSIFALVYPSGYELAFCYGNTHKDCFNFALNTKVKAIIDKGTCSLYIAGSQVWTSSISTTTFSTEVPFCLFGANHKVNGVPWHPAPIKSYTAIIKENDILVRKYTPVYDTITNEYGLYDEVSNSFFRNLGSGSFTGSNQISLTKVGSPTINNGVVSNFSTNNYLTTTSSINFGSDFEIVFKFMPTYLADNSTIFNFRNNNEIIRIGCTAYASGALWCIIRYNDTNNQLSITTSDNKISINNYYYIKYKGVSSNLQILFSSDGVNWELIGSKNATFNITNTDNNIIGNRDLSLDRYFRGSIDLNPNSSYIIINGKKYIYLLP